jgi:hypothetical protein
VACNRYPQTRPINGHHPGAEPRRNPPQTNSVFLTRRLRTGHKRSTDRRNTGRFVSWAQNGDASSPVCRSGSSWSACRTSAWATPQVHRRSFGRATDGRGALCGVVLGNLTKLAAGAYNSSRSSIFGEVSLLCSAFRAGLPFSLSASCGAFALLVLRDISYHLLCSRDSVSYLRLGFTSMWHLFYALLVLFSSSRHCCFHFGERFQKPPNSSPF